MRKSTRVRLRALRGLARTTAFAGLGGALGAASVFGGMKLGPRWIGVTPRIGGLLGGGSFAAMNLPAVKHVVRTYRADFQRLKTGRPVSRTGKGAFGGKGSFEGRGRGWRRLLKSKGRLR